VQFFDDAHDAKHFIKNTGCYKEVQVSKLGDAPEAPLLHRKKSGHLSTHYIFIASCTMRFSWSISCFSFQFSFVLFAAINGWTQTNSF
jgi:hypothetical protein